MKVWYNWPKGYYEGDFRAWYDIAWKILTLPLLLVGFSLFYITLLLNQGPPYAEKFRKDWGLF